eukprot:s3240_g2.t1
MDPEIRKSCVEALDRWTKSDAQTSRQAAWKQYLHWATSDPDAKVRTAALAALTAMLRADPGAEEVRSLAEDVRPNVIKRCNDVDASASAAALRCAVVLAELGSLPEDEYDPIVDLIWDKDEQRRTEAATFVSRFVFSEDVFDYAGAHISAGSLLPVGPPAESRRRLRMLLEFMEDYDEGHKELADRLAAALWCKASCLEDFEAFASLLLGSEVLPPDLHTRLVFLAEATVRRAFEDFNGAKESKHAEAVLDRAVRAFLPRLPALLEACQAEQAAMRRATALCSHLLHHCAYQRRGEERPLGAAGEAAAEAMKAAYLRQTDPEATEHIALALSYLIPLCPGARPIVRSMAATLRTRFMQTAALLLDDTGSAMQQEESKVPPMENLLATAQYLRILTKAADVSECDIEGFMTAVLQLIDQRQDSQRISPQLTVVLLELASLLLVRFAALSMGKRPPCVEHDEADAEKLKKAPTAVEDLMELATGLLESDENPRVRTAAFVSALCVAGAWWNAAHFAKTSGLVEDSSMSWVPSLDERLSHALSGHLGRLLEEANAIPEDTIFHTGTLEAEGILRPSAISQVFSLLSQGLASDSPVTDAETVRLVRLTSLVVVRCRHREVVQGNLPSLLLSMSLSPRADVREVAWSLIKLLRTQAHDAPEAAQEFFKALLKAVKIVHQIAMLRTMARTWAMSCPSACCSTSVWGSSPLPSNRRSWALCAAGSPMPRALQRASLRHSRRGSRSMSWRITSLRSWPTGPRRKELAMRRHSNDPAWRHSWLPAVPPAAEAQRARRRRQRRETRRHHSFRHPAKLPASAAARRAQRAAPRHRRRSSAALRVRRSSEAPRRGGIGPEAHPYKMQRRNPS